MFSSIFGTMDVHQSHLLVDFIGCFLLGPKNPPSCLVVSHQHVSAWRNPPFIHELSVILTHGQQLAIHELGSDHNRATVRSDDTPINKGSASHLALVSEPALSLLKYLIAVG